MKYDDVKYGKYERNLTRAIKRGGREYIWWTNTKRGGYYHEKYRQLQEEGFPILFHNTAYARSNRVWRGGIAVFVEKGQRQTCDIELDRVTAGKLEKARSKAYDGRPSPTLLLLLEAGADETAQRELLAMAYENEAKHLAWAARNFKDRDYKKDAKRKFQFAKELRSGKVGIYLLSNNQEATNMLASHLKPGEEFITNAQTEDRFGFSDTASVIADRLDNSEYWVSARTLGIALDRDGNRIKDSSSVVGVRRHGENTNN